MRGRIAQVAVFVGVFCLFRGYCEWWKSRQDPIVEVNAHSPPDCGALAVTGAADETFNGVYVPLAPYRGHPCFGKEAPRRFLWQDKARWHLSTEPGIPADGYVSEAGAALTCRWESDGAVTPGPRVSAIMPAEPGG